MCKAVIYFHSSKSWEFLPTLGIPKKPWNSLRELWSNTRILAWIWIHSRLGFLDWPANSIIPQTPNPKVAENWVLFSASPFVASIKKKFCKSRFPGICAIQELCYPKLQLICRFYCMFLQLHNQLLNSFSRQKVQHSHWNFVQGEGEGSLMSPLSREERRLPLGNG